MVDAGWPVTVRLVLVLALCCGCFRVVRGDGLAPHPYFQVFGSGPLTNLGSGDMAVSNASAHMFASIAIPLLGEKIAGRRGLWISGLSWVGYTLLEESMYHCPGSCPVSGAYNSELRTDLISRLLPTLAILTVDLVLHAGER